MKSGILARLFVLMTVLIGGCTSPEVRMNDVITSPIMLGPVHRIGLIVWPLTSPEQRLFEGTLLRNLQEIPGLHPFAIPFRGSSTPLTVPELAHISGANDLLFVNILSHTTTDRKVISGNCSAGPCITMNVPMTVRTNTMVLHIVFLRAFPFHVELDRTVSTQNSSKKIPFSIFQRHFTPPTILNLHLYAKISQHIRYLFSDLTLRVKRPFYPYNTLTQKAYLSLLKGKPVLSLFFLNSEFGQLTRDHRKIPYRLYADYGVTYEYLRDYSLADYYYRKAARQKKSGTLQRFEHQMKSMMVYFIGINFFEKGS